MRITLLVLAGLLTGCAESVVVSRGHGLFTVSVQDAETVRIVCRNDNALACVQPRTDTEGVTVVVRRELVAEPEIVAHEGCHVVHQVIERVYTALKPYLRHPDSPDLMALVARYERDPCHDEDGGVFHR